MTQTRITTKKTRALELMAVVGVVGDQNSGYPYKGCSPPLVDRIWAIWGSYYNIPKAIFYLLKGDYKAKNQDMAIRISEPGSGILFSV